MSTFVARSSSTPQQLVSALRPWSVYALGMAALTLAYFAMAGEATQNWLYLAAGVACVTALFVGPLMHAPGQRRPWFYLGVGSALFVAGDVIWAYYDLVHASEAPFPGVADVFYLAAMPVLARGLHLLARARNQVTDRATLLDAAILTCSVAACAWVFVMAPITADHSLSVAGAVVSAAYPLGDVALLYLAMRLLGSQGSRSIAFRALLCGIVALSVADLVYTFLLANGTYALGNPIDAGWLLSYAAVGIAALHPSMRLVAVAQPPPTPALDGRRLVVLAVLALGPAGAIAGSDSGATRIVAVVGALTFFALVLARVAIVVRELELRVRREAEVRAAAEASEQLAHELRLTQRRFATMAAHELRTPLTGLIGALATLSRLDADRTALATELTDMSLRQATRLARLTEDLVVVAATPQAELHVANETVDLEASVIEAVAQVDGVDRVSILGLESLAVEADGLRLTQVVSNLVRNAMQHGTPGTPVTVSADITETQVILHVHNSGTPIPARRLDDLFEQFGHVERSPSGGLGVGLWIVKRLVTAMGGSVRVASGADGTTFTTTLRRADLG